MLFVAIVVQEPQAAAQTAHADRCGVAVAGSVTNSNIAVDCTQLIIIIQDVVRATQEQGIDPSILRLVARGEFDAALESIEAFAAARPAAASAYLSVGASILMLQGDAQEASVYARRAHEADPRSGSALLRYVSALQVTGQQAAADTLLRSAYRRRAQFGGVDRAFIEAAYLEISYPPQLLAVWDTGRTCADGREVSSAPGGPGSTANVNASRAEDCALGAVASANVRSFRQQAATALDSLGRLDRADLTRLQLGYHLLLHQLVADRLLGDAEMQRVTRGEVEKVVGRIRDQHGPWATLIPLVGALRLAPLLPQSELESTRTWFGAALETAETAPLAALARNPGDQHLLPAASSLMLASFRLQRATLSAFLNHDQEAWTETVRAIGEAHTPAGSGLGIVVRIGGMKILAAIMGKDNFALSRTQKEFLLSEYRMLRSEFSDDPRHWSAYGEILLEMNDELCDSGVISEDDCDLDVPGSL
jgi:tetratricopeptide (TPR) repeat protein